MKQILPIVFVLLINLFFGCDTETHISNDATSIEEASNMRRVVDEAPPEEQVEEVTDRPDEPSETQTPDLEAEPSNPDEGINSPDEQEEEMLEQQDMCEGDAPIGFRNGQRIIDFTLPQCDGTPFELQSQCGVDATNLIIFAGWCSKCRMNLSETIPARIERFAEVDYQPIVIVVQDNEGFTPDAAYCQQIKDTYGINYTILYDPDGFVSEHYQIAGGNDVQILLDEDLIVHYRGQHFRYEETFEDLIEQLVR